MALKVNNTFGTAKVCVTGKCGCFTGESDIVLRCLSCELFLDHWQLISGSVSFVLYSFSKVVIFLIIALCFCLTGERRI